MDCLIDDFNAVKFTHGRRTYKTNCTAATMNYNYIHHINKYAPIRYAIVRTTGTVEPKP